MENGHPRIKWEVPNSLNREVSPPSGDYSEESKDKFRKNVLFFEQLGQKQLQECGGGLREQAECRRPKKDRQTETVYEMQLYSRYLTDKDATMKQMENKAMYNSDERITNLDRKRMEECAGTGEQLEIENVSEENITTTEHKELGERAKDYEKENTFHPEYASFHEEFLPVSNVAKLVQENVGDETVKPYDKMSNLIKKQNFERLNEIEQEETAILTMDYQRCDAEVRRLKKRISYLEDENRKMSKEVRKLETDILHLEKEKLMLSENTTELRKRLDDELKREENNYNEEVRKLEMNILHLKQENLKLLDNTKVLRKRLDDMRAREKNNDAYFKKEVRKLEADILHLKQEKFNLLDNTKEIRKRSVDEREQNNSADLGKQLTEKTEQLQQAQKELKALSRLVQEKAEEEKVELSDTLRPSRISERYEQLYHDHWTKAYAVLQTEKKNMAIPLKDILMACMSFCEAQADLQMQQITIAFTKGKISSTNLEGSIRNVRKTIAEEYGENLLKDFMFHLQKSNTKIAEIAEAVKESGYVQECCKLCWLILVQDPPIAFGPDAQTKAPFDKSRYWIYKKDGSKIKYVVLPPLLHHDGSVLCKGIAQGC